MRRSFALLFVVLAACGHDSPTQPPDNADVLVSGSYALESIDGANVPAAIPHDAAGRSAISGRIDITATGYAHVLVRRTPAGVVDSVVCSGALEPATGSVHRMVGATEPSTVQQWDATHVMVGTSWSHMLYARR